MKGLLERLGARNWQMTSQRRAVAEVLAGEHVHLTADEVHERAAVLLPEISRATVYKTLAELVDLGEIREVVIGGRARRYDPNFDTLHQHLVCEGCGLIRDVYPEGTERVRIAAAEQFGFELTRIDIVFRGLCPSCAARRKPGG